MLTEACKPYRRTLVQLLVRHGASPAKASMNVRYQCALMVCIELEYNEILIDFINNGVNIDIRLHDLHLEEVLPFQYAVIRGRRQAADILLHAGCFCGEFNFVKLSPTGRIPDSENYVNAELQKLLREWNVRGNTVNKLHTMCRSKILRHLYPRSIADVKDLPIPTKIIRFPSLAELY